jgi:RNA polymerase sigma-70 factor (ECF subfamily)
MESGDSLDDALAHARDGDEGGFFTLWTDLQPRLLRYLRVLGCEDVDDVASETWLQAVRDLERFRGSAADFRGWLFTIGRHRALDAARARTRFRDKILGPAGAAAEPRSQPSPVEEEVLYGLSTSHAVAILRGLSRDQAEVVALRIIAGLDTEAVAAILGKSPGSVRAALHRGLRALSKDPRIRDLDRVVQ